MPPKFERKPTDDFRDYLEQKFINLHESLENIQKQSEKTEAKADGIINTMNHMTITQELHFINCPNTKAVSTINSTLAEFLFFKKYWKPLVAGTFLMIVLSLFGASFLIQKAELMFVKNQPHYEVPK